LIIPFFITLFVIIADQVSKYIVKTNMELYESFPAVKNILNIHYIENEGASFGMLKDHRWIFMALSTVALVFMLAVIVYLNRKQIRKSNVFLSGALSLMFGGGIGNMIDRVFNESAIAEKGIKVVVDFLEFDFVDFAVFNVADSFICIGSVLFCLCIFLGKYKLTDREPEQEEILPEPEDV